MYGIILFTGFRQTFDKETGLVNIYSEIYDKYANDEVLVTIRTWKTDPISLANLFESRNIKKCIIVGYSWGVGKASIQFAQECKKKGIEIESAIFCEPVKYSVFALAKWISHWITIDIPDSIKRLSVIKQRNAIPSGNFKLNISDQTKLINMIDLTGLNYDHYNIDEYHGLKEMVMREVELHLNR